MRLEPAVEHSMGRAGVPYIHGRGGLWQGVQRHVAVLRGEGCDVYSGYLCITSSGAHVL